MVIDDSKTYAYTNANLVRVYVEGSELTDRGDWMPIGSYAVGEVVNYSDALYIAIAGNTGIAPTGTLDDYWSPLVEINEDGGGIVSNGSDAYARMLAQEADSKATEALSIGSAAYDLAETAYALAISGTAAAAAYNLAEAAYVLAQIGTNTGTAALEAAAAASNLAQSAYTLGQAGTNAAASAASTAQSAWILAQIGTNVGTAALEAATAAGSLAAANTSQIGVIFQIAVDGTNAAATALSTAESAWALAQIGTNTGSAAYDLAQQAYLLATAGTTAGAAYGVAQEAWILAQIGTNVGTAAYQLAQQSSNKFEFGGTFYGPVQIIQSKQVIPGGGTYASPRLILLESDGSTDSRRVDIVHQFGTFNARFYSELGNGYNWLAVTHTGSRADTIGFTSFGSTSFKHNNQTVWTSGNDGSNSGLDADLLDGVEGSYYSGLAEAAYTLAQIGTNTGTAAYNRFTNGGTMYDTLYLEKSDSARLVFHETGAPTDGRRMDFVHQFGAFYGRFYPEAGFPTENWLTVTRSGTRATSIGFLAERVMSNGGTIWTNANDGAGSGLDADLLDGQHGTYYTDLASAGSNLAWQAYVLAQIGTTTGGGGDGVLAQSAWTLAQIGTNVGTTALELAQEAKDEFDRILTNGRCALMVLCSAFTPVATGPDAAEVVVPYEFDGSQSVDWTVRRLTLRVASAGSSPSIALERSTTAGAFNAINLTTLTIGSNAYEGATYGIFGTVTSGDKLRMNVLDLGTAQNWFVSVQLYHPFA